MLNYSEVIGGKRKITLCKIDSCLPLNSQEVVEKNYCQYVTLFRSKSSFRKFYGQYGELIQHYEVSLSRMLNAILTLDLQWLPNRSDFAPIS